MELKNFIAQTLTDIAEGVAVGSASVKKLGGIVNPKLRRSDRDDVHNGSQLPIISVEFTVGLSEVCGEKTKGGIGVALGMIALGSQSESTASTGSTTHLKFRVPMVLPRSADGE